MKIFGFLAMIGFFGLGFIAQASNIGTDHHAFECKNSSGMSATLCFEAGVKYLANHKCSVDRSSKESQCELVHFMGKNNKESGTSWICNVKSAECIAPNVKVIISGKSKKTEYKSTCSQGYHYEAATKVSRALSFSDMCVKDFGSTFEDSHQSGFKEQQLAPIGK